MLIKTIWSLMATNDESQPNPMIPHLYQRLKEVEKLSEELTSQDKLKLY